MVESRNFKSSTDKTIEVDITYIYFWKKPSSKEQRMTKKKVKHDIDHGKDKEFCEGSITL